MYFRSLRSRIATLCLVSILLVQLASFLAVRDDIDRNARASVREELATGERVLRRLLDQSAQELVQDAQSLAADDGIRNAIGSRNGASAMSALSHAANRGSAALTLLIDADRSILAPEAAPRWPGFGRALAPLIAEAGRRGSATGIGIVNDQPHQIAVTPVRAHGVIGWVALAHPVDQRLVADMRALSSLHVSVLTHEDGGDWAAAASTLSAQEAGGLLQQLRLLNARPGPAPAHFAQVRLGDADFSTRIAPLAQGSGKSAVVALHRSVDEAIAPYRGLRLTLLMLTVFGIAAAAAGSAFMARRIAAPLRQLAAIARQLGQGTFHGDIGIRRKDEIGELSNAFDSMRADLAARALQVSRLAYWDPLTELPNRPHFTNLLSDAIEQARVGNASCPILMLDLDRFRMVNDILGHSVGDALLRQVAQRLLSHVTPDTDHVARLGGDEFAILLPGADIEQAQAVAARILKSLETPISLGDQTIDLGAGIGIAGFPDHGADAQALLSHAEVAMYAAKNSGNEAVVYSAAIDKRSRKNLSLLSELRRAVERNEFVLYVQPKVKLDSGEVTGLEALVRWAHPEKGMIYPDSFIPFAEQTGFIRVLTRWVLEQSAALCRDLAGQGLFPKISVNLSARDLHDQALPERFADILARHQVTSASFCLEITESAIMDDPVRAMQTLEALHAMHVELAIDDFGTGYSSLAYLKRLPVDELKIDKSFVMNMERDAEDAKIVRSTIDLGHNMGLRVVAEGLENSAVWRLLADMGCDQAQGYFISKPMPSAQFAAWMGAWTPPLCIAAPRTGT